MHRATTQSPTAAETPAIKELLRSLVSRWETVDFSVSANCFDLDERMQAWDATFAPELPAAYVRQ